MLANNVDPDQCHIMWHLIWVCTVCQGTPFRVSSLQRVKKILVTTCNIEEPQQTYRLGITVCVCVWKLGGGGRT